MNKKNKELQEQLAQKEREREAAAAPYDPTEEDFEVIGADVQNREAIARPSVSFWQDAMRRLFSNKVAVFCLIIIGLIVVMAIVQPMVSPFTEEEQHVTHSNVPMFSECPDTGHMHVFGTDALGRDLFTRAWMGARVSLTMALTAVIANYIIGLIYGGISGYFGGALDNVMMRIIEIINGVPYLIVLILFMLVLGPGVKSMVIAYIIAGWTGIARLTRGQIVSLKEQEFVVAARAMGASPGRIIIKHLIPNLLSVVIVQVTMAIPGMIFNESFLSFIGLGVPIPTSSWGQMANDGFTAFRLYPYQMLIPAVLISLTMLSFNLLGDALRDSVDPKLRR